MATPDPEAHSAYNNGHRAFLQAFMSRATMKFEDSKPILAHIFSVQEGRSTLENDITLEDFRNMINTINGTLQPFDMEIRSTYPQVATTRSPEVAIYALVNLASDPSTQLATSHSPEEIAYVKRVLDAMFDKNNTPNKEIMAVSSIDAINLAKATRSRDSAVHADAHDMQTQGSSSAGLTKERAQTTLKSLVEEGWFERSRGGWYSLTPRSLVELRDWLAETYNEPEDDADQEEGPIWQRIKTCYACKEIITIGQRCADRDCLCRFHDFCARRYFSNQQGKKCPDCKADWTGETLVGERATVVRTSNVGGRPSNASRGDTTLMDEDDTD